MTALPVANKKIGLVLSAGGAKGAYQIGCLRSLRKAGLTEFGGLAGTSVGAINAVLTAGDNLEAGESVWRALRFREIFSAKPLKLVRLPFWVGASLFLELLRSKFRALSVSELILKQKFSVVRSSVLAGDLAAFGTVWALFGLAFTAVFYRGVRRAFLPWSPPTNNPLNALLDQTLTEANVETLRRANVPVYATLSRYRKGLGWVPQYCRMDQLSRTGILSTLLESSGFAGSLSARYFRGAFAVDGKWADAVPAAPLLFDPAVHVDTIVVINVEKRACPQGRLVSWRAALWKSLRRRSNSVPRDEYQLRQWAAEKWRAYSLGIAGKTRHGQPITAGEKLVPESHAPESAPSIVFVIPSEPLGTFYWFSRRKTKRLIKLGEKDMDRVLTGLGYKLALN